MRIVHNIRVGKADVSPSLPSHTRGIAEGNTGPRHERDFREEDGMLKGTARRSTGISWKNHQPIDSRMPNLPPP